MINKTFLKFVLKKSVDRRYSGTAADFLSEHSGLSKGRIKDAMNKGAVWLTGKKGKTKRLRKASAQLHSGDRLALYYDEKLLSRKPPEAVCLLDSEHFSVWYKPAGLMAQGTKYGDHCSLLRQAELFFRPKYDTYLVHRLDREVPGIMLVAHSRKSAAGLSVIFQNNEVEKEYRAEVRGDLRQQGNSGNIKLPLDGKPAATEFELLAYDAERDVSSLKVFIKTGRYHQIRRHFNMIGHPVMGDPRYGRGNKNSQGIKLSAVALRFHCPIRNKWIEFSDPWV